MLYNRDNYLPTLRTRDSKYVKDTTIKSKPINLVHYGDKNKNTFFFLRLFERTLEAIYMDGAF